MTSPQVRLATALSDRYTIERELGQGGMATVYQQCRSVREVRVLDLKRGEARSLATRGSSWSGPWPAARGGRTRS
jgi:hypothetical protein